VLGNLATRGWIHGIIKTDENDDPSSVLSSSCCGKTTSVITTTSETTKSLPKHQGRAFDEEEEEAAAESFSTATTKKQRKRIPRRTCTILEVGAINTELLDAAEATIKGEPSVVGTTTLEENTDDPTKNTTNSSQRQQPQGKVDTNCKKYNIRVRAIDIHSMEKRIEEADFLDLPYISIDPKKRYDVIVCSMVLNCVTTPTDRGKMLCRLYHHLRPGGLCFLTIPKFCLTRSAFLTPSLFQQLLQETGVGFEIQSTKESPRISFFILMRPTRERDTPLDPVWTKQIVRNKGKKFPNQFSVVLSEGYVFGTDKDS
jgi:hypothetical protein